MLEKKIFFFGIGRIGEILYRFCCDFMDIEGFIDNSLHKQGYMKYSKKIWGLQEFLNKYKYENVYIIITSNQHEIEIAKQLKSNGLKEIKDFCFYKDLFKSIFYDTNQVLQGYVELYITDRCTLNCKHCALLLPFIEQRKNVDIEKIKQDVNAYFSIVDKVMEFRILGGEPLLYDNLACLLKFLKDNYSSKIMQIKVVTNGTLIPQKNILELMNKYDIELNISNYNVDASQNIRTQLINLLKEYKISYRIMNMEYWVDVYGDPYQNKHRNVGDIKKLFNECNFGCRTIHNEKLYYCAIDCAAKKIGIVGDDREDYFELSNAVVDFDIKEKFLDFDRGKVKRGFVSFCKNCNGSLGNNQFRVGVAEQYHKQKKF